MEKPKLNKAVFWKLTEELFGPGYFDGPEERTSMEIRSRFFRRVAEDLRLRKSPVYDYWMHRTVFDLFEREVNQEGPKIWM